MNSSPAPSEPIYSSFADDEDYAELIEMFLGDLPARIAALRQAQQEAAWDVLQRHAHQLKGAGGSYGFAPLTDSASALEQAVRDNLPPSTVAQRLDDLVQLCGRLRGPADE